MRILRVIPTLDPEMGGPQTTIVNAAIAETQEGLETTLIFTGDGHSSRVTASARARLSAAGVRSIMFPRTRAVPAAVANRLGLSWKMSAWLLRNASDYDVLHADYVWALTTLSAAVAGRRARKPVVLTAHESLTHFGIHEQSRSAARRWMKIRLRNRLMQSIDLTVMTSEMEQIDSMEPGEKSVVIPHPVVARGRSSASGEPSLPPLSIGYVGRLHPKKNIDVLLRAIATVEAPVRLIVCGDGSPRYRAELESLGRKLGPRHAVEWRGHVAPSVRARMFSESHVVAMPSAYECFGMAAAEAMAAGVPVIVSRQTGVAPVVDCHRCGLVVDGGDASALAEAIKKVQSDPDWRRTARSRALEAASENYDFASYGHTIASSYRNLLSE